MPIGKNAIKRVENNGYSNVKTAVKKAEVKPEKQGFERVSVGNDMPYYLL